MNLTSKQIAGFICRHFLPDGDSSLEEFQVLRHLMREYEYVLSCEEMSCGEAEAEHGEGEDNVG